MTFGTGATLRALSGGDVQGAHVLSCDLGKDTAQWALSGRRPDSGTADGETMQLRPRLGAAVPRREFEDANVDGDGLALDGVAPIARPLAQAPDLVERRRDPLETQRSSSQRNTIRL